MKIYRFVFTTDGSVLPGEIKSVMQAGLEERVDGFNKKRMGSQLVYWRTVDGPLFSPQPIDRYIQLFMNPRPLEAPLRLIDLYVKYFGITFPYNSVRVVQDPTEIFTVIRPGNECDIPIYITCQPKDGSVTISLQIIEAESLAKCRSIFLSYQRRVEDLLVT